MAIFEAGNNVVSMTNTRFGSVNCERNSSGKLMSCYKVPAGTPLASSEVGFLQLEYDNWRGSSGTLSTQQSNMSNNTGNGQQVDQLTDMAIEGMAKSGNEDVKEIGAILKAAKWAWGGIKSILPNGGKATTQWKQRNLSNMDKVRIRGPQAGLPLNNVEKEIAAIYGDLAMKGVVFHGSFLKTNKENTLAGAQDWAAYWLWFDVGGTEDASGIIARSIQTLADLLRDKTAYEIIASYELGPAIMTYAHNKKMPIAQDYQQQQMQLIDQIANTQPAEDNGLGLLTVANKTAAASLLQGDRAAATTVSTTAKKEAKKDEDTGMLMGMPKNTAIFIFVGLAILLMIIVYLIARKK